MLAVAAAVSAGTRLPGLVPWCVVVTAAAVSTHKPLENAKVSQPLRSTACSRQVSAADWTTTRSCEARCSRAAQILRIRLFQASRLLWTSPSNVRYVFDAVAFQTWLCCLSRLPFVPIAIVATATAVCCSQPSCRSRCLACRCFVPMHFTELPFSILLLHLLDFLPLGSASCIAAAAHFLDVPAKRFREYVRTIKRACSRKLRPLLELGFNAPCLSFRHQPALLWDPWLQPTECPWHPVGGDSGFAQREDDVEASVCRLAASYLGLPAQGPAAGAFQRFLAQDGFAPLRLLHCVGAAPLQYQVTSFCLFSSCSLFSLHFFFLFRTAQANEDALAWLPLYNHDLGGSEEYDDAVLWLHRSLQQTVWYPHLGHSSVPASVRTACPQLPAPGEAGSFLLLYIRHLNLGMMLVCWEAENAAGWPRMGGTAWRETAPV